jgi:hypothetical protein
MARGEKQAERRTVPPFRERLNREWAIEIGRVENLYFISDQITKTMIEHGLSSVELPHQNGGNSIVDPVAYIQSHERVLAGLYEAVRRADPVNQFLIRSLHAVFTEHQDFSAGVDRLGNRALVRMIKGQYKRWPNNPSRPDGLTHEHCPPEQVDSEMGSLVGMHSRHVREGVPVEVEAAWFHHRFVQIHPFQDGNGRMARALASLIFIRAGFLPPVVTLADKPGYLDALDRADSGDLKPFVDSLANPVVSRTRQCLRLHEDIAAVRGAAFRSRDGTGKGSRGPSPARPKRPGPKPR